MLTPEQLQLLLSDLESDRIERTTSTKDTDKFARAVCAFANDLPKHRQPVDDKGALSELKVTEGLLEKLGALNKEGQILPAPALNVEKIKLPGGEVAVVEVYPSDLPPVRYKGQVWIRTGPRQGIANEEEERILSERRTSLVKTFDARAVPDATISDISMRLFDEYRAETVNSETIKRNHRTTEQKLASLRCFDLNANVPTVAGILLFGNNPCYFLPGAYVRFAKFPGTSITERPEDELGISGDLRSMLDVLRLKIIAYNKRPIVQGEGFRNKVAPDYPEWALRELLHNAVMHRNYESNTPVRFYWFSDRIEISNPGGLYGEVTRETLDKRNSYRNPVLAEAMQSMGYVERLGSGIQRVKAELLENGNPPPDFDVDDLAFLVTIRGKQA